MAPSGSVKRSTVSSFRFGSLGQLRGGAGAGAMPLFESYLKALIVLGGLGLASCFVSYRTGLRQRSQHTPRALATTSASANPSTSVISSTSTLSAPYSHRSGVACALCATAHPPCAAGGDLLCLHGRVKPIQINLPAIAPHKILCQINRKPIGVVEFKRGGPIQGA